MDKVTEKDRELIIRMIKSRTAPRIIASMFRGTMKMKENEKIVEQIAADEGLRLNDADQEKPPELEPELRTNQFG